MSQGYRSDGLSFWLAPDRTVFGKMGEGPLLAISGHSGVCSLMSAFGGKADIEGMGR
jgi:hypothetical protein